MTARQRVIQLLTRGASKRISFSFVSTTGRRVTVGPSTFERVATAIQSGRVALTITNSFAAGVGAEYISGPPSTSNPSGNELRVPPQIGRLQIGGLMHEAVHASFDLTRSGGVRACDEEAAAYIAEYVYYRRMGLSPRRVVNDAITQAARPIAETVIRRQPITGAQVKQLHSAISNHPTYAGGPEFYLQDG